MALPALMLEAENPVEERIARLETNVEHIRSDVSDVKLDIRRLNDRIDTVDQKLTARIDAVEQKLTTRIDAVDQKLSARSDSLKEAITSLALTVEKGFADAKISRALDRVWWLLMSAALLGIVARGLKWI